MSLTKVSYSMIQGSPVSIVDYGAIGDGVTDNTAAIQAAFNTSSDVFIPNGIFLHTGLTISVAGKTVFGNGNNSILKLKNASNKSNITVSANYVTIQQLGLDGNKANQTDVTDINASGVWSTGVSNLSVLTCEIDNAKRNGIASNAQNENCIYRNNRIVACDFVGIYNANSGSPLLRSVISGNIIQSPGQDGIGTVGIKHCTISNNTINQPAVAGIALEARCDYTTVTGNTVFGAGVGDNANGIQVNDSYGVSVSGNTIYGNSVGVSVSGGNTSRSVNVTGNNLDSCRVSIQLDGSSAQTASSLDCYEYGITVTGNSIRNSSEMAVLVNALSGVNVTSNQIVNFATSVTSATQSRNRAAIAMRTFACFNVVNDNFIYDDSGSNLKVAILEVADGLEAALSNSYSNNIIQNVTTDYGLQFSTTNASTVVRPLRTSAAPTTGNWATGQISYNSFPASGGSIGWVSSDPVGGSFGSATTTGSITIGLTELTVASSNGFQEGMTITVAGAITGAVIIRINHTTKVMSLSAAASATVAGAAVALKNPVFKTWGVIA